MTKPSKTETPFTVEVPKLLAERGLTVSDLARAVGVSQPYLSRVINGKDYKTPANDLPRRVAIALDLPENYFSESRERWLTERIKADPKLRQRLYERLRREDTKANA